nr:lysylphosphatidylglycerol synthase transmembrane domain-containing protein [uncultured Pseudodesulfovibrio sp.]
MTGPSTNVVSKLGVSKSTFAKAVAISFIGSFFLLGIVIWNADWDLLQDSFIHISLPWFIASACFMVAIQLSAGLRLAHLLPDENGAVLPVYGAAVEVSFMFQALIKLLPFRMGEAAYFWLAKKKLDASFEKNLGVFLRFRLWDLRIIAISFIMCGGWIVVTQYTWLKVYVCIAAGLGVAFFMLSPKRILGLIQKVFKLAALLPGLSFLRHFTEVLDRSVVRIDEDEHKVSELTLFWQSLLIWSCYYGVFYCLMRGIGMEVSVVLAIAVSSGMTLVGIVPIQTIGGLGLVEIGQSSMYVLAGIPAAEAASRSLTVSCLFLSLSIVIPLCLWGCFVGVKKITRIGRAR